MSLDIGDTLQDGVERVGTQAGAIFVAMFAVISVARAIAWSSLFAAVLRWIRVNVGFEEYYGEMYASVLRWFLALLEQESTLDYVEASIPIVLGLLVAIWATRKLIGIGAIRWFVEKQSGSIAVGHFLRRFVWTVANLLVGGVIYFIVVALATVFFIIPGIYLGIALYFFKFEIIVEGENAFSALGNSWELTQGNRLVLFALGLLFFLVGGVAMQITGFVAGFHALVGQILTSAVWAAAVVTWIAIISEAYNRLRGETGGAGSVAGAATREDGPATL